MIRALKFPPVASFLKISLSRRVRFLCLSLATMCIYTAAAWGELSQENCRDIRLDQPGGSMYGIPVRLQEDDICYAHAAVDLFDARGGFQSNPSSPLDAAAHFKSETPGTFVEAFSHYWGGSKLYKDYLLNKIFSKTEWGYGILKNILDHLKKEGVCPESKMVSDAVLLRSVDENKDSKEGNYRKHLREFWERYQKQPDQAIALEVQSYLKNTEESLQKKIQEVKLKIAEKDALLSRKRNELTRRENELNAKKRLLEETQELERDHQTLLNKFKLIKNKITLMIDPVEQGSLELEMNLNNQSASFITSMQHAQEYEKGTCRFFSRQYQIKEIGDLFDEVGAIEGALKEKEIRRFYSKLFSTGCQERRKLPEDVIVEGENIYSPKEMEIVIQSRFDQAPDPKQPFAISYCSRLLTAGASYKGKSRWFGSNWCAPHASVVIGRRFKNNRCELLIKNSWGSINVYSKDFESEDGKIWVPVNALADNTFDVVYLRP